GRGDRVKGDNPVRRVCAAIARALGIAEPPLYVAKLEPAVVLPTATEPPGMLVGLEVPKRYHSRQQRFLYGRALAHIRRGTHALVISECAGGLERPEIARLARFAVSEAYLSLRG